VSLEWTDGESGIKAGVGESHVVVGVVSTVIIGDSSGVGASAVVGGALLAVLDMVVTGLVEFEAVAEIPRS